MFLTISIVNQLISKREPRISKQYLALRQPDKLEIKVFQIFRRETFRTLVAKTKRKNILNKKQCAMFEQHTLILVKVQEHLAELCRSLDQKLGHGVVV